MTKFRYVSLCGLYLSETKDYDIDIPSPKVWDTEKEALGDNHRAYRFFKLSDNDIVIGMCEEGESLIKENNEYKISLNGKIHPVYTEEE